MDFTNGINPNEIDLKPINLYSDTQTLPTEEMLDAIRAAELGDDTYGKDPTVKRFEEMAAAHRGLALAGNAYHGVGLPASIPSGVRTEGSPTGALNTLSAVRQVSIVSLLMATPCSV